MDLVSFAKLGRQNRVTFPEVSQLLSPRVMSHGHASASASVTRVRSGNFRFPGGRQA